MSVPISPCACRKWLPSPCHPTMFGGELERGAGATAQVGSGIPSSPCMPRCDGSVQRPDARIAGMPVSTTEHIDAALAKGAPQACGREPGHRTAADDDHACDGRGHARAPGLGLDGAAGQYCAQEFFVRGHAHRGRLDLFTHRLRVGAATSAPSERVGAADLSRRASRAGRNTPRASVGSRNSPSL